MVTTDVGCKNQVFDLSGPEAYRPGAVSIQRLTRAEIPASQGRSTMKWLILAALWIFLFLVWHAHTIFDEED